MHMGQLVHPGGAYRIAPKLVKRGSQRPGSEAYIEGIGT